jgi:hypothetical protein
MDSGAMMFLPSSESSVEEKDLTPAGNRILTIGFVAHHRTHWPIQAY